MPLDYRILAITLNVLANQLGVPVPVLPTLLLAGAWVAQGTLSPVVLLSCTILACLAADSVWFAAGRVYGNRVMKLLCRISLTPDSCVSNTQGRFERWGSNVLLVAKFVPGLSLVAPPLAGATRMSWPRFVVFSALGSGAWLLAVVLSGFLLRHQIEQLLPHLGELGGRALSVLIVLMAAYIAYKWWERRRFYAALRMARIEVAELSKLMKSGGAPLVLDVRSPTAVTLDPRRIPGALLVPLQDIPGHLNELPRDRDVIAYCTCPNEASAAQVAKVLMKNGFKKVRPLQGGLDAWVAAGHSVELIQVATIATMAPLVPKGPLS